MSLNCANRFLLSLSHGFRFSFLRHREYTSNSEEPTETSNTDATMSRRTIVPPESVGQHHYVPQNPAQSFNYARQQPTPPPQRKHIQHDPDVFVERDDRRKENGKNIDVSPFSVTQSRSFQMLKGWISDSEKTPSQPAPAQPAAQPTPPTNVNRSAGE